jgi:hypothetical protein
MARSGNAPRFRPSNETAASAQTPRPLSLDLDLDLPEIHHGGRGVPLLTIGVATPPCRLSAPGPSVPVPCFAGAGTASFLPGLPCNAAVGSLAPECSSGASLADPILRNPRLIHNRPKRAPVRADSASRGLTGAGVVSLVRWSWRGVAGCPRCEGAWATTVPTGGDPSHPPELHSKHYLAGIVFPNFRTVTKAADPKPRHYPFEVRHDKQACHEWLTTFGLEKRKSPRRQIRRG